MHENDSCLLHSGSSIESKALTVFIETDEGQAINVNVETLATLRVSHVNNLAFNAKMDGEGLSTLRLGRRV